MVNRNLIRSLEDDSINAQVDLLLPEDEMDDMILEGLEGLNAGFDVNQIVNGKVVEINSDYVVIDVGFKSEGAVSVNEWDEGEEKPTVGSIVKVLIEEMEDELGPANDIHGMISLSKRKAEKILEWEKMMSEVSEGQVVTGTVTRKIKGGLLVDIGVNVFLPASQVDIRRPNDIADYIGRVVQCEVLKIDETRRNIVVSRRSLIEKQREEDREHLLGELEIGQIRKGIVKNIADFGAFVDLGGIDGLLHITDMSWERISHPTEMVAIDQEIEVKVLQIDREKQKIALGLEAKAEQPLGQHRREVSCRHKRQGRSCQCDELRSVCEARAGHRGLGSHQRNVVDSPHQPPQRTGANWRRDRHQDPGRRPCRSAIVFGHEADRSQSVGRSHGQVPRRERGQRQGSQLDQLRCVHRARTGHRWLATRLRHVVDS